MSYTLRFLPEIEGDLLNGYKWYETKSAGLGDELLRIFYAYANGISRDPLRFPKVYGEFRRRLLRRFPYAIYFRIEGSQIVVFGLFHCARNPRAIKMKIKRRK